LLNAFKSAYEVSFASQKSYAKGAFASKRGLGGLKERVCISKGLNRRIDTYTYGKLE
jgi:hypothetical protein